MSRSTLSLAAGVLMFISAYAVAQGQSTQTFPKPAERMNQDYLRPHVGILAGYANPESNFDTAFEYGADIGFQPWVPFGLGVELSGISDDSVRSGGEESLNRTNLLGKASYHLGGTVPVIRDSYLGVAAGAIFDASSYKGVHTGYGPTLGFDIPLTKADAKYFSLGVAAKYVFISGPSPDSASVNGMAKYWF